MLLMAWVARIKQQLYFFYILPAQIVYTQVAWQGLAVLMTSA